MTTFLHQKYSVVFLEIRPVWKADGKLKLTFSYINGYDIDVHDKSLVSMR